MFLKSLNLLPNCRLPSFDVWEEAYSLASGPMEHLALAIQEEREREGVTWRQGRWCVNSKRVLARALVEVRGWCDKGRIDQQRQMMRMSQF